MKSVAYWDVFMQTCIWDFITVFLAVVFRDLSCWYVWKSFNMSSILTVFHLYSYTMVKLPERNIKRGSSFRTCHTFEHICVVGSDYSQSVFLNEEKIDYVWYYVWMGALSIFFKRWLWVAELTACQISGSDLKCGLLIKNIIRTVRNLEKLD